MRVLEGVSLEDFDLNLLNLSVQDNLLVVTKMSWDYEKSHAFQELMVEKVSLFPEESVFIFCNHPSCLTLGRGLQKSAEDDFSLVDFDPFLEEQLEKEVGVRVHHIKRGGGITFHHENQFIFYPIIALENKKIKIFDLLLIILEKTKVVLEDLYQLDHLNVRTDLLGLWAKDFKVASVGVSARKFISYHGLALNLSRDPKIETALSLVYPCGLSGAFYKPLDELYSQEIAYNEIQNAFLKEFKKLIFNNNNSTAT